MQDSGSLDFMQPKQKQIQTKLLGLHHYGNYMRDITNKISIVGSWRVLVVVIGLIK